VADVTKAVEIVFGVIDKTGTGLASVGAGLSSFAASAQDAISPLNTLADAIKVTDTAIVALGLAFGGAALQKAGEFDTAVAEIGILFGGTSEQVKGFGDTVIEFAGSSTQGLGDITAALALAVGSGIEYGESLAFIQQAEMLAVAGSGDLASATDVLVGSMNAYGAAANEAGEYSDILMQTVLLGKTTLPELARSLSDVTSTAAAGKIPFSDLNAAVAALTAAGIPTSQAMTTIKAAIGNIITPSKQAQETAGELGIQFDATALATKGFDGVLKDVYKATGGNITQIATLFGSMEALKGVTVLGADASGIYAKSLTTLRDAAGSTQTAFDMMSKQWDATIKQMDNTLNLFMVTVGRSLNADGEFSGLIKSVQGIFQAATFSINEGAFDSVFDTLGGIADRMSSFFTAIAKALPEALDKVDFSKFNSSLENLATSLGGLFGGVDLTTPEGLADAIQLVVDVIANLLNQGAGIAQTWAAFIDGAMPVVRAFADMSEGAATASGKVIGFGDVLNLLLPGLGAIGGAIESVGTGLSLLAGSSLLKTITGFGNMSTAAGAASTAAGVLATALGPTALVGAAGAAGYAVGTVLSQGINAAVDGLTGSGSLGGLIYDLTHDTDELSKAAPKGAEGVRQLGDAAGGASGNTQRMRDSVMELRSAATDTTKFITPFNASLVDAGIAAGEARLKTEFLAAATKALKDPTKENKTAMNELAGSYKDTATWSGHAADAGKVIKEAYDKLNPPVKEANVSLKTSAGVMEELGKKTDLTGKDLITLAKNVKDAEVKLAELASNEKIKTIEAKVKLDIANVEANAKIATALIEGVSNSITSTGEVLKGLQSQMSGFDNLSFNTQYKIEAQMEKENKRRDDAFKLQKDLTEAQIAQMKAQTEAMLKGDGLIKIDGAGLQPHLEAFMWEILKAIQVKVNKDGLKMLLGT